MPSELDAYLAAIGAPVPTAPSSAAPAAPGAVMAPHQAGTWETVLRAALPAVAGFLAARNGTLGSFTGGYQDAEAAVARQRNQDRQFAIQQENQRRLRDAEARQRMEDEAQAEYRRAQTQALAEKSRKEAEQQQVVGIQKRLDEAAKNPLMNTLINAFGSDGFAIDVPGLGPVNLRDARERGAIIPGELGVPPKLPKPEREPLITDATGTRVPDKPGVKVKDDKVKEPKYDWFPNPDGSETYKVLTPGATRGPKKPTKAIEPKGPKVAVSRGEGPELDKIKVDDPVSGLSQTVSGASIIEKMKRAGIPETSYDALLKDPEALAELVRTF